MNQSLITETVGGILTLTHEEIKKQFEEVRPHYFVIPGLGVKYVNPNPPKPKESGIKPWI